MKPRILTAGFFHETHTFVDELTQWKDFSVARGADVFKKHGDASPTDGFLEEAARQGFEVIPTLDARATPGGTVADAAFEVFWAELGERAAHVLARGVDGIFLVLRRDGDGVAPMEGELLARIGRCRARRAGSACRPAPPT